MSRTRNLRIRDAPEGSSTRPSSSANRRTVTKHLDRVFGLQGSASGLGFLLGGVPRDRMQLFATAFIAFRTMWRSALMHHRAGLSRRTFPGELIAAITSFISYAVEQAPIAEWLARRLASLGYAVWMDRLKFAWRRTVALKTFSRPFVSGRFAC